MLEKCYCPYCGEKIEVIIDTSVDEQEYIEDCSVCCRPIVFSVWIDQEQIHLNARSENE